MSRHTERATDDVLPQRTSRGLKAHQAIGAAIALGGAAWILVRVLHLQTSAGTLALGTLIAGVTYLACAHAVSWWRHG